MSDVLKAATETLAAFAGGVHIDLRYWDLIHPPEEETRTEEDIKAQVFGRLEALRKGGET